MKSEPLTLHLEPRFPFAGHGWDTAWFCSSPLLCLRHFSLAVLRLSRVPFCGRLQPTGSLCGCHSTGLPAASGPTWMLSYSLHTVFCPTVSSLLLISVYSLFRPAPLDLIREGRGSRHLNLHPDPLIGVLY